jgi:hypothetical protein
MWIRKPDLEIKNLSDQKELRKKSLNRPLVIGTVFGLFFMLVEYFGFRGGMRGVYSFSAESGFSWRTLFVGFFGFIMFFALARYHQKKGWSFLSGDNFLRCAGCRELSPVNIENVCQCGGRLEPSEYYTWEDEELMNVEIKSR